MSSYETIIHTGDLFDIMERSEGAPFYDTMQILDDEEHETNSPDRLSFFQDLLKNQARTAELDRTILAPWLLVYLWQKTDMANYTCEAWRTLIQLNIEDELMVEAAIDILQHHPHGTLRAEVLQWQDRWLPHQDDDTIIALSGKLAFEDPHPGVRINAIEHYHLEGGASSDKTAWVGRMLDAMQNDPAAEVRAAIIHQLAYVSRNVAEPRELFERLREALHQERDGFVACQLLSQLISKGRFDYQLETTVIALNYVKSSPDSRFEKNRQAILQRLRNHAGPWLEAAPFPDVDTFRTYLESHFKPGTAELEERVVNYRTLMQTARPPVPNDQDLMDLFFDVEQTTETIGLLLDDLGDVGFKKLFAMVASPVSMAETRAELLEKMVAFLKTKDRNGDVLGAVEPMNNLLSYGVKVAMGRPPDAEALWAVIHRTIAEGTEDWTWALQELKWTAGQFELAPLVALVGSVQTVSAARGAAELLVELFGRVPGAERAAAVAEAWTLFAARTDLWDHIVCALAYRMPHRSAFADYPIALGRIDQAMRVAQAQFNVDQSPYATIDAWLSPPST